MKYAIYIMLSILFFNSHLLAQEEKSVKDNFPPPENAPEIRAQKVSGSRSRLK